MKRLFIMLFVTALLFSGCSTNVNTNMNTNETTESNELPEVKESESQIIDEEEKENKEVAVNEISEEETELEEVNNQINEEPVEEPVTQEMLTQEQTNENAEKNTKNNLKIKGLVQNELILTVEDLKAMTDIIFEADFYSLNSFGTTGYTHFKGAKLWELLYEVALIKPEATKITVTAQDGYSMEFTIEQVQMEYMDETNPDNKYSMIIAWEEKGEEYSTDEGAPYKLVIGQKEPGDVNKPQWVSNIDVIIID